MIKSVQNPYIKYLHKLQHNSEFRKSEEAYIIEGAKILSEALKSSIKIRTIIFSASSGVKASIMIPGNIRVAEMSEDCFKKISLLKNPQGVAAVINMPEKPLKMDWINPVLICDGVSDPGNLGTIIRTADAMLWPGIICVNQCVDIYSPKVIRASMGSHFRVPVMKWSISELKNYKEKINMKFYGATPNAEPYQRCDPINQPLALVLGNEANGISNEVKKLCDEFVGIPISGETESLNVSVAAGILMNQMKP